MWLKSFLGKAFRESANKKLQSIVTLDPQLYNVFVNRSCVDRNILINYIEGLRLEAELKEEAAILKQSGS